MNIEPRKIRALIVDDEPIARRRVRDLLKLEPDIEVCGECDNGQEALESIRELAPDLVFLDIQMPGLDGISMSESFRSGLGPEIVFVTAYDNYAVKAFELRAVDYLLKPFDRGRFSQAVRVAREKIGSRRGAEVGGRIIELLDDLRTRPKYMDRIVIRNNERIIVVRVDEIDWIESEGNYVRIHFGKSSSLVRETLTHLASQLDPDKFPRIHRSRLVNIDSIQELQHWSHRNYRLILRSGVQLSLSRSYRDRLSSLLGKL